MLKTETKTIKDVAGADHAYACSQFPARFGVQIQARLMVLLAPVLGGLTALAPPKGEKPKGLDPEAFTKALAGVAAVKPDEFLSLAVDLLKTTQRDSKVIEPAVFDLAYAGNYLELYQALLFAVETNFSSLFGASGISGLTAKLMEKAGIGNTSEGSPKS